MKTTLSELQTPIKRIIKNAVLICIAILIIAMISLYLDTHTYYNQIIANAKNRQILIACIAGGLIPTLYVYFSQKPLLKNFVLYIVVSVLLFGFIHQSMKGGIIGSSGFFLTIINKIILLGLGGYFIVGILGLGTLILEKYNMPIPSTLHKLFFGFGIGLAVFLLFIHFLILAGLLYWPIVWLSFLGLGYAIWLAKDSMSEYTQTIETRVLGLFTKNYITQNPIYIIGLVLLVLSIMYYLLGFELSFIPYSTARDANHAYMYYPKILAENNGTRFGSPAGISSSLWITYITFWFSLIEPISGRFRLAPSTIGVSMNFLSGIFVLLIGCMLIYEVMKWIFKGIANNDIKTSEQTIHTSVFLGRAILLLRLSSAMGAFLVFIDNKTDLGVMTMTILALLGGFMYIDIVENTRKLTKKKSTNRSITKEQTQYLGLSGLFFSLAFLSKQTALQDILIFGLIITGLWVNIGVSVGLGIMSLGFLSFANILTVSLFIPTGQALSYIIVGGVITFVSGLYYRFKQDIYKIRFVLYRALAFIGCIFVIKSPQVIYQQVAQGNFSIQGYIKGVLLSSDNKTENKDTQEQKYTPAGPQLAGNIRIPTSYKQQQTITPEELQDIAPHLAIFCPLEPIPFDFEKRTDISLTQCREEYGSLSKEELFTGLQSTPGGGLNEDLQRYIGFGQKEFVQASPGAKTTIGYFISRIGFSVADIIIPNQECGGRNMDAIVLCKNKEAINTFDIKKLEEMRDSLPYNSEGSLVLRCILSKPRVQNAVRNGNINELQSEISALTMFWQNQVMGTKKSRVLTANPQQSCENNADKSLCTQQKSLLIPFRYIVPFNVSIFNELQNLSSYYTDIGYVFFLFFLGLCFGTIYLTFFIQYNKKEQTITHPHFEIYILHIMGCIGWAVWWAIGSAIFWYGIGLILWTMIANITCLALCTGNKKIIGSRAIQIFGGFIAIVLAYQLFLNFIRISSQGGEYNFVWYKGSSANVQSFTIQNGQFSIVNKKVIPYTRKHIFDLQFGHYNRFIEDVKDRKDEDGILIAGTYMQYFLHNQKNIKFDSFLSYFSELLSDNNLCKGYLRMKEDNIKYVVVDPNILTVVMGDGNSTLRDRLFAVINPNSGIIERHGVMSALAQMVDAGFIQMDYSNNLSAYYAYELSQAYFQNILSTRIKSNPNDQNAVTLLKLLETDLPQFRATMALARFFPQRTNQFIELTAQIFETRAYSEIATIDEIAMVYGKQIDLQKLSDYYTQLSRAGGPSGLDEIINQNLSEDEMFVFVQYNQLRQIIQNKDAQRFQDFLRQIIQQSLGGSSQLIVFERL